MPFSETGRASDANTTGPVSRMTESGTSRLSARVSSQITPTRASCTTSASVPTSTSVPRVPAVGVERLVEPAAGREPVAVRPRLEHARDDPAQAAREEERQRAGRGDAERGLGGDHARAAGRPAADGDGRHGQGDEGDQPHEAVDQHRGDRLGRVVRPPAELDGADGVAPDRGRQELAGEEGDEVRSRQPGERGVDALRREQEPPPERHHRHRGDAHRHRRKEPAKLRPAQLVQHAVDPSPVQDRREQDARDERLQHDPCPPAHRSSSA